MSKTQAPVDEHAADRVEAPRLPPRAFVRTAWLLHRAAYRITGGRFGLSHPEAGSKFDKAQSLGVAILDEEGLKALLRSTAPPQAPAADA